MLMNLLLGLPTMVLCLLVQSLLLVMAIRYYYRNEYLLNSPSFWSSLVVITSIMLLVVGNLVQVAVWAMLFRIPGEFQQFNEAFYHSAVNFATLGYGDLVMSDERKLPGPLESINGVLMIGISTAAMLGAFQDAVKKMMRVRKNIRM